MTYEPLVKNDISYKSLKFQPFLLPKMAISEDDRDIRDVYYFCLKYNCADSVYAIRG